MSFFSSSLPNITGALIEIPIVGIVDPIFAGAIVGLAVEQLTMILKNGRLSTDLTDLGKDALCGAATGFLAVNVLGIGEWSVALLCGPLAINYLVAMATDEQYLSVCDYVFKKLAASMK